MTGTEPRDMHPVVALLRELREAAGLSLHDVERMYGVKATVVGSYERGNRRPTVEAVQRLLDFYGHDLVTVPRDRAADGRPTVRSATQITTVLRQIADQLEPDELPATSTQPEPAVPR
jgi:transcriptional regulator with XRE-family HTH domain